MPRSEGRARNVLFMIADDHRSDAIGACGNPAVETPHFDGLIERGTSFSNAFTTVPICTPARAEVLTGCDAFRNGVRWFGEPIRPELVLLPQALRDAGITTFFTGKWHNDARPDERGFQIARRVFNGGMRSHEMTFEEDGKTVSGFSSELFAEAASEFIRTADAGPWFAYVAFTSPHDPRTPPEGFRPDPNTIPLPPNYMPEHPFDNGEMTIRDELLEKWPRTPDAVKRHLADYYGMIAHMDAQVGRILDALEESGQADDTLVIYTSDHGLAVGSHGLMGKMSMYDHSVRVPLLFAGPGVPSGRRVSALCHGFDLYRTICEALGVPTPETVEGLSLIPVIDGERERLRDHVCGAYRDVQRMIRTPRWKLIHYPKIDRTQLFDLDNDPHEMIDLLLPWRYTATQWYTPELDPDEIGTVAGELLETLTAWQREVGDPVSVRDTGGSA